MIHSIWLGHDCESVGVDEFDDGISCVDDVERIVPDKGSIIGMGDVILRDEFGGFIHS